MRQGSLLSRWLTEEEEAEEFCTILALCGKSKVAYAIGETLEEYILI